MNETELTLWHNIFIQFENVINFVHVSSATWEKSNYRCSHCKRQRKMDILRKTKDFDVEYKKQIVLYSYQKNRLKDCSIYYAHKAIGRIRRQAKITMIKQKIFLVNLFPVRLFETKESANSLRHFIK